MEVRGQNLKASYVATGTIVQYRLMNKSATGLDVYTDPTTGTLHIGVSQNKPQNDEECTLVVGGHTKIQLANSLGAGITIMAGANGIGVRATSGQFAAGILVQGATSGSVGELSYTPFWLTASL